MMKIFDFGKIAYKGNRKINSVEVWIELENEDNKPVFNASAHVYNSTKTDVVLSGQCFDELSAYINNKTFQKIKKFWCLYHCNNLHPGTPKQEKAIRDYLLRNHSAIYTPDDLKNIHHLCDLSEIYNFLESIDLLVDNGHKYGSDFLYEPIPEDDLKEIKALF